MINFRDFIAGFQEVDQEVPQFRNRIEALSYLQQHGLENLIEVFDLVEQKSAYLKRSDLHNKCIERHKSNLKALYVKGDILSMNYQYNETISSKMLSRNWQNPLSLKDVQMGKNQNDYIWTCRPSPVTEIGFVDNIDSGWSIIINNFKDIGSPVSGYEVLQSIMENSIEQNDVLVKRVELFLRNQTIYHANLFIL